MPNFWYDYHANSLPDDASDEAVARRDFNLRILADRKPYFMRYIYPSLMKQYNEYMKNTNTKCVREFRMTIDELSAIDPDDRTEEQNNFLAYYRKRLPVGTHDCVMNKICRRFEQEFDHISLMWREDPFDYTIMKSGTEYTKNQMTQMKKLYDAYNEWLKRVAIIISSTCKNNRDMEDTVLYTIEFQKKCLNVCSSEDIMTNILLDMCYTRSSTKKFAWDMCTRKIVENLADRHGGVLYYPARDPDGDIEFSGLKFSMKPFELNVNIQEGDAYERDSTEREEMGEGSD